MCNGSNLINNLCKFYQFVWHYCRPKNKLIDVFLEIWLTYSRVNGPQVLISDPRDIQIYWVIWTMKNLLVSYYALLSLCWCQHNNRAVPSTRATRVAGTWEARFAISHSPTQQSRKAITACKISAILMVNTLYCRALWPFAFVTNTLVTYRIDRYLKRRYGIDRILIYRYRRYHGVFVMHPRTIFHRNPTICGCCCGWVIAI